MNRFASAVMVAGAGMVGLGMTATLAGAQTHPATYPPNDVMQAPFASAMLPAPCAWFCGAHRPEARKRTRNCSSHKKPPPSRTRRFCSSTAALKDRCCWGSIPTVRIAGCTHSISTSSPRATSCCQSTIAGVPAMACPTERPTTSAPAAAASSMTWSALSPICEADMTSTPLE